jgi:DNA-binding transcriptional regulator YiaG
MPPILSWPTRLAGMTSLTPETIRTARLRLGLTQLQFADRIGCSSLAVSFWERGTRSPTGLYARAVQQLVDEANALPAGAATDPAITPAPSQR